jgi:transcriptional regulator with GAF, ATPase, and Fis domain
MEQKPSGTVFVQDPANEWGYLTDAHPGSPLEFEQLISAVSAKLINLPTCEIDKAIQGGLEQVSRFVHADRAALLEFQESGIRQTVRWAREGIPLLPEEVVGKELPWIVRTFRSGTTMVVPRLAELPDEAKRDREAFAKMGQLGFIGTPLMVGGEVIGGIGYAFFRPQRLWSQYLIERLQLLGQIFGSGLNRKLREEQLQQAIQELKTLKSRLEEENLYLQQEIKHDRFGQFVGTSAALQMVLTRIEQVAFSDSTVLILGETGTGKELVARAIHDSSRRRDRPLVKVNCATLPSSLIESELFGHEKGAFTGAHSRKIGRFELADKGTLFLDEIGELQMDQQVKLLRVLQEGEFERVGSTDTLKVDVRLIAATNRNLEALVAEGKFRSDLYYRLNVFPITCPPLRERPEDVPILVAHFVEKCSNRIGKKIDYIAAETVAALISYRWPGNIREVQNVVERSVLLARSNRLELAQLLLNPALTSPAASISFGTLVEQERKIITSALQATNWRISGVKGAAKILGLNPKTLESKIKKLSIKRPS